MLADASDRPPQAWHAATPPSARSRITHVQRRRVVKLYTGGLSALAVAEEVGLAKSSVLSILKREGVEVRPQGQRMS